MPWRGRLIREHMRQQGVSQEKLAVQIGTWQGYLSELLRGVHRPRQATWNRMADALNIPRYQVADEHSAGLAYLALLTRMSSDDAAHHMAELLMDITVRREQAEAKEGAVS